jgi:membrane associated rhomboid family serine protease
MRSPLRAHISRLGARIQVKNVVGLQHAPFAPFASRSSALEGATRKKSGRREKNQQKGQVDASRKASLLLNRLSQAGKTVPADIVRKAVQKKVQEPQDDDEASTVEIDENEEEIQKRIVQNRTKLLWPGIWTFFAVTGTYGVFAYMDARYADAGPDARQLPERAQLPQTWFLTPEVIKQGVKAGWNELDKLTIGVVVASVAIHLMKKSPLPFWEKLIHITGETKYTAFTYPFVHSNWAHLSQNMFVLCWFMPGVVRYLDGDFFHAAALFVSVPLLTSYLQHFAFRWGSVTGLPMNMGSSGAIAAMCGAFCVAYPSEKVWTPSGFVVRLDSVYWGGLFVFWQLASMVKTPKGGNRTAHVVSV